VLREAGVVDAGGYGLTVLFAGVIAALRGSEPPEIAHHRAARVTHPQHESSTHRYCVNFAVTGRELKPRGFVEALERIGDSVLVVGDETTLKVHVHSDDPDAATALFDGAGAVSHLDVADMHQQVEARDAKLAAAAPAVNGAAAACGALAVVSGEGIRGLYEQLGFHTLDGGATLNPSTYDLLAGIHAVSAEEVVVLPNSPNVFMAAERAAELSEKQVRVVRSRSQQAGLAAALAFDPSKDGAANDAALGEALERVRTGAVAPAARDDANGRFRTGEAIGFVGDELVAWGAPEDTLRTVLATLADDAELVTCLSGDGAPIGDTDVAALSDGAELEVVPGGQPAYWWLLSAE
jgi:dihydroxyacetone kinase-like predicted kinase